MAAIAMLTWGMPKEEVEEIISFESIEEHPEKTGKKFNGVESRSQAWLVNAYSSYLRGERSPSSLEDLLKGIDKRVETVDPLADKINEIDKKAAENTHPPLERNPPDFTPPEAPARKKTKEPN